MKKITVLFPIDKKQGNPYVDELAEIMSKDFKISNVYLMALGGVNKKKILELLNEKKYYLQKYLSEARLRSKFTPKIKFFIDDTFDEAEKIEKLLLNKNVKRDLN